MHAARAEHADNVPSIWELFRGDVRKITVLTILVCSLALTAHWAFNFWSLQHLRNLPDVAAWTDRAVHPRHRHDGRLALANPASTPRR